MPKRPIVDQFPYIGWGHCADACLKVFGFVNDKPNEIEADVLQIF